MYKSNQRVLLIFEISPTLQEAGILISMETEITIAMEITRYHSHNMFYFVSLH